MKSPKKLAFSPNSVNFRFAPGQPLLFTLIVPSDPQGMVTSRVPMTEDVNAVVFL